MKTTEDDDTLLLFWLWMFSDMMNNDNLPQ